ncbi:MAG: tRNA (adenosine(37)-N6)-dimethylallyltransferase MiaA, partial [Clostridia bacterium]|nr:tRNA (adenosine(37)-N6)-dimethylallyltransferase MiaA [Clostridia bacterium]
MKKPLVIVVLGPTASGKTSLAIEIAKKYGGEIVSADSMQIYKDMDIATAKPTKEEQSEVKHHLIGFVDCDREYSVAMYKKDATEAINHILSEDKLPVVCGGTGLYIDTLINNTSFFEYEKTDVRRKLEEEAEESGIAVLYERLKTIDPCAASRLHINDRKRIIRALEVYLSTGKTITEQDRLSHTQESEYDWCIIGLTADNRQILYDRINLRVEQMLDNGLLREAEEFFKGTCSAT